MEANDPVEQPVRNLRGQCVLIVEDEYFLADDLAKGFTDAGIAILGPVPSLSKALMLAAHKQIGGAILDINLDGEKVYDVADALLERGVPLVFVTGYDKGDIPTRFADVPFCQKPAEFADVIEALERAGGR